MGRPRRRMAAAVAGLVIILSACGAPEPRLPPNNLQEMPDVTGQNVRDAQQALEDQGYTVEIVTTPAPDRQPGTVLATDPEPGNKILRASTIRLQVAQSAGPTPRGRR